MKLFLINLGLTLVIFVPITAQTTPLVCDTASFPEYFITQLPGLGIDATQAGPLLACTDFVTCLPITTAFINTLLANPIDEPYSAESWATVCPECMLLNALIITMIIYFQQSQSINQVFPLASLSYLLTNVTKSPAIAPTQEQCAALFTSSISPSYPTSALCEATIYLGNLYESLNIIAQAKLIALNACYLPKIIAIYQTQTNGLATCINDALPSILNKIDLPAPFPPVIPIDSPITITIRLQNEINALKNVLAAYNADFERLTNCCTTADQFCQLTFGPNLSTEVLLQGTIATNPTLTVLQNLVGYQAFNFTSGV